MLAFSARMPDLPLANLGRRIGRYALYREIAAGGMATVHLGRLLGPVGFARTVAIKRLHPQFAKDPDFATMFLDEARLAARIRHPNVVSTLDVVSTDGELFLVMDYVQGESLSRLMRRHRQLGEPIDLPIIIAIMVNLLHGLHAAHEARSERGEPLNIVHRDVSPHNVLLGVDGVARVVDFGVAKAAGRVQSTRDGQVKGKLAYMAPEQVSCKEVDRRSDVYAATIVLWEMLAGKQLFEGDQGGIVYQILQGKVPSPSKYAPQTLPELDDICQKGLSLEPAMRFSSALELADALEAVVPAASARQVGLWVERMARTTLEERSALVAEVERDVSSSQKVALPTGADLDASTMRLDEASPREPSAISVSIDEGFSDASTVRDSTPSQVSVQSLIERPETFAQGAATGTLNHELDVRHERSKWVLGIGLASAGVLSAVLFFAVNRTPRAPVDSALPTSSTATVALLPTSDKTPALAPSVPAPSVAGLAASVSPEGLGASSTSASASSASKDAIAPVASSPAIPLAKASGTVSQRAPVAPTSKGAKGSSTGSAVPTTRATRPASTSTPAARPASDPNPWGI